MMVDDPEAKLVDGPPSDDFAAANDFEFDWPFAPDVVLNVVSAADRQKLWRARQRAGQVVAPVIVNETDLLWLIKNGKLPEELSDQPRAIGRAILDILRSVQAAKKA